MAITLLDNSNTIFDSYLKGWELALKTFEEEVDKQIKDTSRNNNKAAQ